MPTPDTKTAIKTAKPSGRNGNVLPLGAHPGNTGGKKGRSGKKPDDFIQWCKDLAADPEARRAWEAKAKEGDHKILDLIAKYGHGLPTQKVDQTTTVILKAVRE